jgi:hypothetical protein
LHNWIVLLILFYLKFLIRLATFFQQIMLICIHPFSSIAISPWVSNFGHVTTYVNVHGQISSAEVSFLVIIFLSSRFKLCYIAYRPRQLKFQVLKYIRECFNEKRTTVIFCIYLRIDQLTEMSTTTYCLENVNVHTHNLVW